MQTDMLYKYTCFYYYKDTTVKILKIFDIHFRFSTDEDFDIENFKQLFIFHFFVSLDGGFASIIIIMLLLGNVSFHKPDYL